MSPTSNALDVPYGSAQQVAGSPNASDTPLGQRLDGSSSALTNLSTSVEIMNERDAEQRQHMTELTHMVLAREDKHIDREAEHRQHTTELTQMVLAREDKHADRMERMLQLHNEPAPRSPSTLDSITKSRRQYRTHTMVWQV